MRVDFDRLVALRDQLNPLGLGRVDSRPAVMDGSSGLPGDSLEEAPA